MNEDVSIFEEYGDGLVEVIQTPGSPPELICKPPEGVSEVSEGASGISEGVSTGAASGLQAVQEIFEQPISMISEFLPQIIAAAVLLVLGWLLAMVLKSVVGGIISRTGLDHKFSQFGGSNLSKTGGKVTFWTIMAFTILAVLKSLNLDTISEPLMGLMNSFFEFVPVAVGAGVVFCIFGFISKIAKSITVGSLDGVNFNSAAEAYVGEGVDSSGLISNVVGAVILFTGVTQAVDILNLEILSTFVGKMWEFAVPVLLGTGIIVLGAIFSPKLVGLVSPLIPEETRSVVSKYLPQGILGLATVTGLYQMNLINPLLNTVIPIVIGGFALALALKHGLSK